MDGRGGMDAAALATTPGMLPPPGHTPQFDAPYTSLQIGIFVAFGASFFLATVFLGLRYFQALKLTKQIKVDLVNATISYGLSLVSFVTMFKCKSSVEFWGNSLI